MGVLAARRDKFLIENGQEVMAATGIIIRKPGGAIAYTD